MSKSNAKGINNVHLTNDPGKTCRKCGASIPINGEVIRGEDGSPIYVRDEYGVLRTKVYKTPRIACEKCARAAAPPLPAPQRLRKGEKDERQAWIDAPMIYIGKEG